MSYIMSLSQPLEIDTPVGALSRLNLSGYDRVVDEFRRRHEKAEAAKKLALTKLNELADQLEEVMTQLPEQEATGIGQEFRHLEIAEHLLADGIAPQNADELYRYFEKCRDTVDEVQKGVKKLSKILVKVQKFDGTHGARLIRLSGDMMHALRRLTNHYQHMISRAKLIAARAKAPQAGPVERSYRLYAEAFRSLPGILEVGGLNIDLRDRIPLYELPIRIDPNILMDHRRLGELERAADENVAERDPAAVGAIAFRFEPIQGAA